MAIDPRYMSFDHKYVETVTLPGNVLSIPAYRVINRSGAFPAADGYGAGVTIFDANVPSILNYNGYNVRPDQLLTVGGLNYADLDLTKAKELLSPATGSTVYAIGDIVYHSSRPRVYYVLTVAITVANSLTVAAVGALLIPGTNAVEIPDYAELYKGSSITPNKPSVLLYQKYVSIVTEGIAIVELDPAIATAVAVDSPLFCGANGKVGVGTLAASKVVIGRSLDAVATPAVGGPHYVRVRVGSI